MNERRIARKKDRNIERTQATKIKKEKKSLMSVYHVQVLKSFC